MSAQKNKAPDRKKEPMFQFGARFVDGMPMYFDNPEHMQLFSKTVDDGMRRIGYNVQYVMDVAP